MRELSFKGYRSANLAGIPQLKMPSVDPMFIPEIRLLKGTGPVAIDSNYKNLTVEGITNFDVKQLK
jgi:hypothetical protein